MKKIFSISASVLCAAMFFASCEKDHDYLATATSVNDAEKAFLKINFATSYAANPGFQISVNKARMSSLLTSRTPFPGGGYNTNGQNFPDYLPVDAGSVLLAAGIPYKNTATDSVPLFSQSLTLAAGKRYTAHVTDTTAAKVKVFLIEDDITPPAFGNAKYKFVNLMPNLSNVDLYYGSTVVAANIAYGAASSYFTLPLPTTANPVQTWAIRQAGVVPTTANIVASYLSSNTVLNQHVYTVFAQGYNGSTDAVRKPYVAFYLNY